MNHTRDTQWRLPNQLSGYVILLELGSRNTQPKEWERIPDLFITVLLDNWIFSGETTVLHDIYKTLGGSLPSGLTTLERSWYDQQLKRRLRSAFLRGELMAFRVKERQFGSLLPPSKPPLETKPELERTFIAIQLVDQDGQPVSSVRYRIETPDGRTREGTLNTRGEAREEGLVPGQCTITFPELDGKAWQSAD